MLVVAFIAVAWAGSPPLSPACQVLPVAVRGGQFPIDPITRMHIKDVLEHEELLNHRRPASWRAATCSW